MIDAHIHVEQYDNLETHIPRWQEAGLAKVVAVSNDLESSYRTLEIKERYPDFILAGVGFHPEYPLPGTPDFQEWLGLVKAERERISCIGEVGLPHYELERLLDPLEAYEDFLRQCLQIAKDQELPVALHAVHDKAELVFQMLQNEAPGVKAHFHWLKAPSVVVEKIVEARYYISVTPEVCYRKRDQLLSAMIPLEQLLIETDGPWPFEGPFAGTPTSPLLLHDVIHYLAEENDFIPAELTKQIHTNALRLFEK
ncbi:TatD family hydrolase [Alteribacillus sp. HJP-4]|uniref:TatD family hydrolase n=1 Tax=Alteribacillus sp. HJP-4 TaxID=2775394 RepID=UPI0035CCD436